MSDIPIEQWKDWVRRDDWHQRLVGSDIRQMLGEIERLRHAHYVSDMTGRSLSRELQANLLDDTAFADGDFGPLSKLTGEVYRLFESARDCNDKQSAHVLNYVHELICRARHEISGDPQRELPPKPEFLAKAES